jgi:hypothetical protein
MGLFLLKLDQRGEWLYQRRGAEGFEESSVCVDAESGIEKSSAQEAYIRVRQKKCIPN